MTNDKLFEEIRDDLTQVEVQILRHIHTEIPLLNEVAQYILESGGKRLRPAIMILSARMFDFPGESIHQAAGAVEYLHTATLLHDDVVDGADERRARKAARMIWGNQASVLVGDYLLATAFRTLTMLGNQAVLETISSATAQMAKGEILQLIRKYDSATEEEYLDIVINKTASLFAAAARIGGLFAGAGAAEQEALQGFGHEIGIAFQIKDDALDYAEEREQVGKPLGTDLKERKVTLPLSRLLQVAGPAEKEQLAAILAKEIIEDGDVLTVVAMMNKHGVADYTLERARSFVEQGKNHLNRLPDSPHKKTLLGIAEFLAERNY